MMGHVNSGDLESAKAIKSKLEVLQSEYQRIGGEKEKILLDSLKSGEGAGYKWMEPSSTPSGSYIPREVQFRKPDSDSILKNTLSELYGIPQDIIDVTSGTTGGQQLMSGMLSGDEKTAAQYLAKNFKAVQPIEINGKTNFLAKTNDDKYLLVNQPGFKWKDVYASILPEVIPTAYGIIGGALAVAGAPESAGSSLLALPLISSAFYATGKGTQTAVARSIADIPIDAPQIGIQMAKDTIIGTALGTGTGMVVRSAIKSALPAVVNAQEVSLGKAIMQTKKLIPGLEMPAGSWGGSKQMDRMRSLAGEFPKSNLAKQYTKNLDRLETFQKAYLTGEATPDATRQVVLDSLKQDFDNAAAAVAGKDQELKNTMLQALNDRLERVTMAATDSRTAGEAIEQIRTAGAAAGKKMSDASFADFFNKANQAGAGIKKGDVAAIIDRELAARPAVPNPTLTSYSQSLKADPDAFIPADQIRDYQQLISAQIPTGYTVQHPAAQIASASAKALKNRYESMLAPLKDQNGQSLLDVWKSTVDTFQKTNLAFRVGSSGAVGAETMGSTKLAPTEMVAAVLKNEKTAGDFIGALHNAGKPELAEQAQRIFQSEYLKRIGAAGTSDSLGSELTHTPEMVDALFGRTPDGAINQLKSARMMGTLDSINEVLKLKGIKPKNIQSGDVDRVLAALSDKEKQTAIKILEERAVLDSQKQKLVQNKLMAAVKKGDFQLADMDQFAETLMTATPEEVGAIIPKLPLSAQDSVKRDFLAQVGKKFSTAGTAQRETGAGVELWDGRAVIKDLAGWERGKSGAPTWVKNMDKMFGQEFTDSFLGASKVNAEGIPFLEEGLSKFPSGPISALMKIARHGYNKALSVGYGNGLDVVMRSMSKNVDQAALDNATKRMANQIWKTPLGYKALAHQSRNDPDFAAEIEKTMAELGKKRSQTPFIEQK